MKLYTHLPCTPAHSTVLDQHVYAAMFEYLAGNTNKSYCAQKEDHAVQLPTGTNLRYKWFSSVSFITLKYVVDLLHPNLLAVHQGSTNLL